MGGGGGNSDILKQVYAGAVRLVAVYASSTWNTASKTNKSKLDRVHGHENYLRSYEKHINSNKWKRQQTFNLWSVEVGTKLHSKGKS